MLRELGLDPSILDQFLIDPCAKPPKARAGCWRVPPPLNQTAPKSAVDVLADKLWERYFSPKDIGLEETFKGKSG